MNSLKLNNKKELGVQQQKEELALKHERKMRALELNAHGIAHGEFIDTKIRLGKNVKVVPSLMNLKLISTFNTLNEWLKI